MTSILPVIDLKEGVVVRGIAGQRDRYLPVNSVLTKDPSPAAVARAFHDDLGFRDAYIADLDAIAGAEPAWNDYEAIARMGLRLWVDAGSGDSQAVALLANRQFAVQPIHRIIVGLESLASREQLAQMIAEVSASRLVFSLDLKAGRPLTRVSAWRDLESIEILSDVLPLGIDQLIILDLTRVGVGQGTGTEALCRQVKQRWPHVELIGGGGINSRADIEQLTAAGLSRVLVASALHDGRIA